MRQHELSSGDIDLEPLVVSGALVLVIGLAITYVGPIALIMQSNLAYVLLVPAIFASAALLLFALYAWLR